MFVTMMKMKLSKYKLKLHLRFYKNGFMKIKWSSIKMNATTYF